MIEYDRSLAKINEINDINDLAWHFYSQINQRRP